MSALISQFDAGSTVYLELAFADRLGVPNTPSAVSMQINDITNGASVYANTPLIPPTSPQTTAEYPIASTLNVMTRPTASQTNKVIITATLSDGSIVVADYSYVLNNPLQLATAYKT